MIAMPEPDAGVIGRREDLVAALRDILPADDVIDDARALRAFECDGLSAYRALPMIVVLPRSTGEVSRILALCRARGVKVVPRGAGTGLSGGALPLADGVTVGFGKLNRILEIDTANRCAVVQPGVANLAISTAVATKRFGKSPGSGPSGWRRPWGALAGFTCPLAAVKSGAQLPTPWRWMPCGPGGSAAASTRRMTPLGTCSKCASPTVAPLASTSAALAVAGSSAPMAGRAANAARAAVRLCQAMMFLLVAHGGHVTWR